MTDRIRTIAHRSDNPVAVVAGLGINGYGVVRALALHRVPIIALDPDVSQPLAKTRLCHTLFCADIAGEPLFNALDAIARQLSTPPILFLTTGREELSLRTKWNVGDSP
jgi:hypothetical protein